MAKDLGIIGPSGAGRWVWPFREMEVGDFFRVEPHARPINEVRTTAYCRGYQLGRKFSVVKGEDGRTRVERVDPGAKMRERYASVVQYNTVRRLLMHFYKMTEIDVDGLLPWTFLEIGQSGFHKAYLHEETVLHELVTEAGWHRIHVEMLDDGIRITRIGDDMTLADVVREREEREEKLLLELMG